MLTIDLDKIKIKDGDTILDLGCGRGRHIHKLYYYKKCHVIGLDLSLEDIKITYQGFETYPDITNDPNRHFNLMTGNALSLPFKDETFDQIICSEVLEHIPNYEKAIECHNSKEYLDGWNIAKSTTTRHMQIVEGFSIE